MPCISPSLVDLRLWNSYMSLLRACKRTERHRGVCRVVLFVWLFAVSTCDSMQYSTSSLKRRTRVCRTYIDRCFFSRREVSRQLLGGLASLRTKALQCIRCGGVVYRCHVVFRRTGDELTAISVDRIAPEDIDSPFRETLTDFEC